MPRSSGYRPDFMAYGPHITVLKDKPLTFSRQTEIEADDEDYTPVYKYYESTKILGKLYRAIDEQKIFSSIQKTSWSRCSRESVLQGIYSHLVENDVMGLVAPHFERARGIRDE